MPPGFAAGIDTTRPFETPEGVRLDLRVAGPVVRACAWAIDAGIRGVVYVALSYVLSLFGGVGWSLVLIGWFVLEWLYPVLFEVRSGATPGKRAMGLQVVHDNGTPVAFNASMIRNIVRAADFLPLFYGFGLAAMLMDRDFRRLGDLAAGTLVVYGRRAEDAGEQELPDARPAPLPVTLSLDEQLLLLLYAERCGSLSPERRIELAEILGDITGRHGEEAVAGLHGHACWILEGRK